MRHRLAHAAIASAMLAAIMLAGCAPRPGAAADHGADKVAAVDDPNHPGVGVYKSFCAGCHEDTDRSGAPSLEAIRMLNKSSIEYTLRYGYMSQQAKNVPQDELAQLIDWLPKPGVNNDDWLEAARCPIKSRKVRLANAPRTATRFGIDYDNTRNMSAERAGLKKSDMKKLEIAWAIAFPKSATMRSQPVVIGDTVFIASTDAGRLYALDTNTGCAKWMYASDMTLRSSLAFGEGTDKHPPLIVMGDAAGRVHAVNAETGEGVWVTDVKLTSLNRITGAPVIHEDVVYTPISVIESNFPTDEEYECCKGQGAVAALELGTGKKKWVARTIPEDAKPTRISRSGAQQYGPAGAMIWSTPIIDVKRRQVIVGTGENLSWPATETSDAIIAYDMDSGQRKWVFQAAKNDIWNSSCGRRGANCDWPGEYWSPDFDFGATSMLVKRPDGKEMVIAGQKSGVVWALDPDTGALQWANRVGRGSAGGGVRWGMAYDGERVYVPSNDPTTPQLPPRPAEPGMPAPPPVNPLWGSGLHALDVMTGEVQWTYKPNARDCGQDLPVAKAKAPPPEWKMMAITEPLTPPLRAAGTTPRPSVGRTTPPAALTRAPAPPAIASPAAGATATPVAAASPAAPAAAAPVRPAARCRIGMSPAPLLVDGALVTGTNGGMLRIFDGKTGEVLFEYQTNKAFPNTINGVDGHGGGLDSAPYVAGDGTLFVQSGYARFGEPPGNMLLAFRPKR